MGIYLQLYGYGVSPTYKTTASNAFLRGIKEKCEWLTQWQPSTFQNLPNSALFSSYRTDN